MPHCLFFLPEIALLGVALILLCLMVSKKESSVDLQPFMVLSSIAVFATVAYSFKSSAVSTFYGTYRVDLFSQGFKALLALAFFFTIVLSEDLNVIPKRLNIEYYLFLTTSMLGMMMITSSSDILTLYVSLELSAYSLYLLSGLKQDKKASEASVKYLIFGAATSGLFLWGASLLCGLAKTTSLVGIAVASETLMTQPAFLLGLIFVSFAFLFKLSNFPFHFWAPDVYESSATPVTAFIGTASKAAAVAILIRVFMFLTPTGNFVYLLGGLAFISMTIGNTAALLQKDVKRLLAYSSVAQAGYLIIGLLSGSFEGFSSSFFYAVAYVLMNTAAFLVVLIISKDSKEDNPQIAHFDGLAERSPFLALILLLSLLSLAGIPPLVGFTGKWILFSAAMEKGHWFLVLWAVLNSVVSLFYYLTLVKHAYLEKPKNHAPLVISGSLKVTGLFLLAAIICLGVFPDCLIRLTQAAVLNGLIW